MRIRPSILVGAVAVAGCGHVELHEMRLRSPGAFAPQPASESASVTVYFETERPSRAFYDVALLQVVGYGIDADADHVARALSSRAAALACDAVVGVHVDQGETRAHGYGVCVRWSPLAAQGSPPAPAPAPQTSPPASARDEAM